jgi:nitroreductase
MRDDHEDPRDVIAAAFPTAGTPVEQLRYLVAYAVLAPSGHNTQPWRFRIAGDTAALYADRARALPIADPADRELTIACGAALFHLRLALRRFGFAGEVTLLPDPATPDLLALVRPGPPAAAIAEVDALFAAIPHRRTNRRPFDGRPLPASLDSTLAAAARVEGAWVAPVGAPKIRTAVADLVAAGDRIQWADPRFRRELATWIRPARRGDGLTEFYRHGVGPLVVRLLDLGKQVATQDRARAEQAPLLAVLETSGDDPADWLTAGQALARVLLRATRDGVSASFLHQPIQVAQLRPRLRAVLGTDGFPQIMLRLGYGPPVPPSPRRPLAAVLID